MGFNIEKSSYGPIAVAELRKRQHRPHGGVGVLTAVLAQARRVGFYVARVVHGMVERRREQFHQLIAAADQLRVHLRHGADRAAAFRAAADDRP